MQTATEMAKDQMFKLRLDDTDRAELETLAEQRGVSAAQLVRQLVKEEVARVSEGASYSVHAWDGIRSTALFWVGRDRDIALAKAKDLAEKTAAEGGRWTMFRVYQGGKEEPIKRVAVAVAEPTKTRKR